jgi:hypothetical protein
MKKTITILFILLSCFTLQAQETTDMLNADTAPQSFIYIQGAAINSLGVFKEDWDKGSAGYAGYATLYSNQFALVLETGYLSFQTNDEANYGDDPDPVFSLVPIAVGVRYYIAVQRFRPFFLAMTGANIVSQNYTRDNQTIDKTTVHLHFQIGAGLGILVLNQLEIEGQFKYNSHVLVPNDPYNITGLEYGIALNWHL